MRKARFASSARSSLALAALLVASVGACGGSTTQPPANFADHAPGRVSTLANHFPVDARRWSRVRSERLQIAVLLPDAKVWRREEHSASSSLTLRDDSTQSRIAIEFSQEDVLVNRHTCEARARDRGWVVAPRLTTLESHESVGPGGYDSRLWVAVDTTRADGALEGHVYLFGALLKRCLWAHLSTRVASVNDEAVLSGRLALARTRIIQDLVIDAPRTEEATTLPRDTPSIPRRH